MLLYKIAHWMLLITVLPDYVRLGMGYIILFRVEKNCLGALGGSLTYQILEKEPRGAHTLFLFGCLG
jgi:hypothetical protein